MNYSQTRKTRIEALNDRIIRANNSLNNVYDENYHINMPFVYNSLEEKVAPEPNKKISGYAIENRLNEIANSVLERTQKKEEKKPEENELQKSKEIEVKKEEETEVTNPFIKRMKYIISEINRIKTNSNKNAEAVSQEVSSLKNRALLELSLSKTREKYKFDDFKEEYNNKIEYIRRLENEVIEKRTAMETLKKTEGENLVKISTLEDQIRILKSKVFGYDISKKYEYYKQHEDKKDSLNNYPINGNDDNLAFSMWEKENYTYGKNPSKLAQLENDKQMWIQNSHSNVNKVVNDINNANSYQRPLHNDEDNGLWTKSPQQIKNNNNNSNTNSYNRYQNNNYQNGYQNSNQRPAISNMRKISGMILSNNKNNKSSLNI